MDPVGSWTAYQSAYNRLAAAGAFSTDFHHHHHHLGTSTGSSPTSSTSSPSSSTTSGQIHHPTPTNQSTLNQPSPVASRPPGVPSQSSSTSSAFNPSPGFLTPPPVAPYDSVFSPIFHPHATKPPPPSHYRHTPTPTPPKPSQSETADYHPSQSYLDHQASTWPQQGSPFGILPHETVSTAVAAAAVAAAAAETAAASNAFNAQHFFKSSSSAYPQQTSPALPPPPTPLVPSPITPTPSTPVPQMTHQSCIVNNRQSSFAKSKSVAATPQIHSSKGVANYPERPDSLESQSSSQSSPISFAMMDNPRHYNNTTSVIKKPPLPQHPQPQYMNNYRNYESPSLTETPSPSPYSNGLMPSSNNEMILPRRPSPLQVHSQQSPLNHGSPNSYPPPGYQSPLTGISSPVPQQSYSNNLSSSSSSAIELNPNSAHRPPPPPLPPPTPSSHQGLNHNSQSNPATPETHQLRNQTQNYYDSPPQSQNQTSCSISPNNNETIKNLSSTRSSKSHSKRRKSKTEDYFSTNETRIPPLAHHNPVNSFMPSNSSIAPNPTYYNDYERWNATQNQGLNLLSQAAYPPPSQPPSSPYGVAAPPNGPSYFPGSSVASTSSQLQGQSQAHVAPLIHPQPQSYYHSTNPYQYNPEITSPGVHPLPESHSTRSEEIAHLKPPPPYPKRQLVEPAGAATSASDLPAQRPKSSSSMNRVSVPKIEEELSYLRSYDVFRPENFSLNNSNNGYIDWGDPQSSTTTSWHSRKAYTRPIVPSELFNTPVKTPSESTKSDSQNGKDSKKSSSDPLYDPQDDPRYFPLPKHNDKKRNRFASTSSSDLSPSNHSSTSEDDDYNSEEDKNKKRRKSRTIKSNNKNPISEEDNDTTTPKADAANSTNGKIKRHKETKRKSQKKKKMSEEEMPRRAQARRKAKEKTEQVLRQWHFEESEETEATPQSEEDDPAWSPDAASSDDGIPLSKRVRMNKSANSHSPITPKTNKKTEKIDTDYDDTLSEDSRPKKRGRGRPKRTAHQQQQAQEEVIEPAQNIEEKGKSEEEPEAAVDVAAAAAAVAAPAAPTPAPAAPAPVPAPAAAAVEEKSPAEAPVSRTSSPILSRFNKSDDDFNFMSGEFVILKSDISKKHPPIWRIDGRSLLQKYETFKKNGELLYKNISTYSSWTQQNKNLYQKIKVRYRFQNRAETIVEYQHEDDLFTATQDSEALAAKMSEFTSFQENFDIYIQTLISQALDSTFLLEVLQENDEYFLNNVMRIDDAASLRIDRLLAVTQWAKDSSLTIAVATWPCFNILTELSESESKSKCSSCSEIAVRRIQLYGQPYNADTLDGCAPDPRAVAEKDFLFCKNCMELLILFNKVAHQKYRLYVECAKRVGEMRVDVKLKDTVILNNLLADEEWNNRIFKEVRLIWAEIDLRYEHYMKEQNKSLDIVENAPNSKEADKESEEEDEEEEEAEAEAEGGRKQEES